jgi:hypothetical protein
VAKQDVPSRALGQQGGKELQEELGSGVNVEDGDLAQELDEKQVVPELYPYGSRGPLGAHYLGAKYNVRWGDLTDKEDL